MARRSNAHEQRQWRVGSEAVVTEETRRGGSYEIWIPVHLEKLRDLIRARLQHRSE